MTQDKKETIFLRTMTGRSAIKLAKNAELLYFDYFCLIAKFCRSLKRSTTEVRLYYDKNVVVTFYYYGSNYTTNCCTFEGVSLQVKVPASSSSVFEGVTGSVPSHIYHMLL